MSGNLGAPAHGQVHAGRLQADRDAPAAAEGPIRRMAGAGHLLRVFGPASAFVSQVNRATSETLAHAGDAGRARAAKSVGQGRARPRRAGLS